MVPQDQEGHIHCLELPPRLVAGLSFILIMNLRISSWMFHLTPRTLSSGKVPRLRSLSFTPSFLCSSGIDLKTTTWLPEIFVRLKASFLHNNFTLWILPVAIFTAGKLFRMSFTWTFCLRIDIISSPYFLMYI